MKPRVIFLHGLKTGGTSLRHMLLDEYGYERVAPVPMGRSRTVVPYPVLRDVDPLVYQMAVMPGIGDHYDVVMSHYDWRLVERLPGWDVITMLRHPVDQLISLYQFMMGAQDFEAFRFTAPPFMEWVEGEGRVFLNSQTRMLSGHGCESLDVALRNVRDARLHFGILEYFGESVRRWNDRFGWTMAMQHENRSERVVVLSARDHAYLERLQADDMQVYETAVKLFEEE